MSRAILLAAGEMTRWNNHLGLPKHLIPIAGEPLIHRTQRELAERGVTDIRVVCQAERADAYILPGIGSHAEPIFDSSHPHQHESSRHLWPSATSTLIIYGDTYLSPALLDALAADQGNPWHVYARYGPSTITGRAWGEMFAWAIGPDHYDTIDRSTYAAHLAVLAGNAQRYLGWEVYRAAVGLPIATHSREAEHFIEWDDASDDFDYPDDLDTWRRLNPGLA
jgi:hypothetical protein